MKVFSIVQIVVWPLKHFNDACSWSINSFCRNVSHQQQFFSELLSPGRSHSTNYSFCNDIMVSWYFSKKVSKKNRVLEVFMGKLLICRPERFVVRKTWDYWTKLQLGLSSLANNSAVMLDLSNINTWLVKEYFG